MRRGIKSNVLKRVKANRQKNADVQEHEEREREALRLLNKQANATDVVADMCASVIRVQRIR